MFVIFSPIVGLLDAEFLASYYHEKVVQLAPDCFATTNFIDKETRVTFLGHADTNAYGEEALTPENFVKKIVELGLPTGITVIDLIGCRIGEIEHQTSYAHRVAKVLYEKYPQYSHVRINSLCSLAHPEEPSNTSFQIIHTKERRTIFSFTGIPKSKLSQFNEDVLSGEKKIAESYASEIDTLSKEKKDLEDKIQLFKNQNSLAQDQLQEFESALRDTMAKLQRVKKQSEDDKERHASAMMTRHEIQIMPIKKGMREAFDDNPRFQITKDTLAMPNVYEYFKAVINSLYEVLNKLRPTPALVAVISNEIKIFETLNVLLLNSKNTLQTVDEALKEAKLSEGTKKVLYLRAIENDQPDLLRILLTRQPLLQGVNAMINGRSLLTMAIEKKRMHIVKVLIEARANPMEVDKTEFTPFHSAVQEHFYPAISHMLQEPLNVNYQLPASGSTPLHVAADRNDTKAVKMLLDIINVELSIGDSITNATPLHIAADNNHLGIAQALILNGADATKPDKNGKTPSDLAKNSQVQEVLRFKISNDQIDWLKGQIKNLNESGLSSEDKHQNKNGFNEVNRVLDAANQDNNTTKFFKAVRMLRNCLFSLIEDPAESKGNAPHPAALFSKTTDKVVLANKVLILLKQIEEGLIKNHTFFSSASLDLPAIPIKPIPNFPDVTFPTPVSNFQPP